MKNQQDLFKTTYEKHADDIFRFCYFRTSDRERAKELMQEAFMKTWGAIAQGAEIDNMRAYVYKAARNLAINEIERRKESLSLESMSEESGFDPEDSEIISPDRFAEGKILQEHVQALDPPYREVITLRFMNDLGIKEMAEVIGESENAISVRLNRAMKKLKHLYEK